METSRLTKRRESTHLLPESQRKLGERCNGVGADNSHGKLNISKKKVKNRERKGGERPPPRRCMRFREQSHTKSGLREGGMRKSGHHSVWKNYLGPEEGTDITETWRKRCSLRSWERKKRRNGDKIEGKEGIVAERSLFHEER